MKPAELRRRLTPPEPIAPRNRAERRSLGGGWQGPRRKLRSTVFKGICTPATRLEALHNRATAHEGNTP